MPNEKCSRPEDVYVLMINPRDKSFAKDVFEARRRRPCGRTRGQACRNPTVPHPRFRIPSHHRVSLARTGDPPFRRVRCGRSSGAMAVADGGRRRRPDPPSCGKRRRKRNRPAHETNKQTNKQASEQNQAKQQKQQQQQQTRWFAVRSVTAAMVMVLQRKEIGTPVDRVITDVEISLHCSIKNPPARHRNETKPKP